MIETARKEPDDAIALLLAVCEASAALHELPELRERISREDFLFVKGVASEVDDLPLGEERQYWAPQSLIEKDEKARSYADQIRSYVLGAFARIAHNLQ